MGLGLPVNLASMGLFATQHQSSVLASLSTIRLMSGLSAAYFLSYALLRWLSMVTLRKLSRTGFVNIKLHKYLATDTPQIS